jgi:hypothetical protein
MISDQADILRGERRRYWTTEQKQMIAAQSLALGASPTDVGRQPTASAPSAQQRQKKDSIAMEKVL